jgi:hypothetical protein
MLLICVVFLFQLCENEVFGYTQCPVRLNHVFPHCVINGTVYGKELLNLKVNFGVICYICMKKVLLKEKYSEMS